MRRKKALTCSGLRERYPSSSINKGCMRLKRLSSRAVGAIGKRGVEFVEQSLGSVEATAVAIEASFTQQPDGNASLAGSGVSDQQNIVGAAQEFQIAKGL